MRKVYSVIDDESYIDIAKKLFMSRIQAEIWKRDRPWYKCHIEESCIVTFHKGEK